MRGTDKVSGTRIAEPPREALPPRASCPTRLSEPAHPHQDPPRPAHDFKIGDRVRLSALGKARSPRTIPNGQVVNVVLRKRGYGSVRVLWDGLTTSRRLHVSYIELDAGSAS